MLEKSFGFMFYLKQPKNADSGRTRYIYLRITVDGISKEYSIKRQWDVDRWIPKAGRASGTKEDAKSLNVHLDSILQAANAARVYLLERNLEITSEAIKKVLLGETDEKRMIMDIFKEHNAKMALLIGIDFAPATLLRFKTSYDHTKNFIKTFYGKDDLPLGQLNYEFINEYYHWLKTVRKCGQNSTLKYLSNFKKIVRECILKGWLPRDPFIGFKSKKVEVNKNPLTLSELRTLANHEFSVDRLKYVKDVFLFSCYTGLSYVDVKKLRYSDLIKSDDSDLWISTFRQKTKVTFRIPVLAEAMAIIDKYRSLEKLNKDDF